MYCIDKIQNNRYSEDRQYSFYGPYIRVRNQLFAAHVNVNFTLEQNDNLINKVRSITSVIVVYVRSALQQVCNLVSFFTDWLYTVF